MRGVGTEGIIGGGWDLRNRSISGQSLKQRQGQSERACVPFTPAQVTAQNLRGKELPSLDKCVPSNRSLG